MKSFADHFIQKIYYDKRLSQLDIHRGNMFNPEKLWVKCIDKKENYILEIKYSLYEINAFFINTIYQHIYSEQQNLSKNFE